MLRLFNTKKGQSAMEYAVLIAVVVLGLAAMNIYMKRSVQGRLRSVTDNIGQQYSAGNMTSTYTTTHKYSDVEDTFGITPGATSHEPDPTANQGKSVHWVVKDAGVTVKALGADAETITTGLSSETLFE